jgi:hypothetical protein
MGDLRIARPKDGVGAKIDVEFLFLRCAHVDCHQDGESLRTWMVPLALKVFFRRQASSGLLRRMWKINRSMPIVSEID